MTRVLHHYKYGEHPRKKGYEIRLKGVYSELCSLLFKTFL